MTHTPHGYDLPNLPPWTDCSLHATGTNKRRLSATAFFIFAVKVLLQIRNALGLGKGRCLRRNYRCTHSQCAINLWNSVCKTETDSCILEAWLHTIQASASISAIHARTDSPVYGVIPTPCALVVSPAPLKTHRNNPTMHPRLYMYMASYSSCFRMIGTTAS